MVKQDKKEGSSIVDEIQQQLDKIFKQRKDVVEKELQEKIQREQAEAQKRMDAIEEEMAKEKDALVSFQNIFDEFDTDKVELKKRIKVHLDRAVSLQYDIEAKTSQTMEELKHVSDLNTRLETLAKETQEKAEAMKEDLHQRFGIVATLPETKEDEDVKTHLVKELERLNQIKELLSAGENFEISLTKEKTTATFEREEQEVVSEEEVQVEAEAEPEAVVEEAGEEAEAMAGEEVEAVAEEEAEEAEVEAPNQDTEVVPLGEEEQVEEEAEAEAEGVTEEEEEEEEVEVKAEAEAEEEPGEEEGVEEAKAEPEPEAEEEPGVEPEAEAEAAEEEVVGIEPVAVEEGEEEAEEATGEVAGIPGLKAESADLELLDTLEQYRTSEGREGEGQISFYKNEDNVTLDGEYIIAAVGTSIDEAKKLYVKLSETESPKDQFFVKQEIIRHQEAVRKLMLSCIRMCEKDPNFLPDFTKDILNMTVFKSVLERVSMENWSNQEDFTSFDEYAKGLKDSFYAKITPPAEYLQSLIQELKIQTG